MSKAQGQDSCIKDCKNGSYKVALSWESLTVSTAPTRDLTEAIDWQIALLRLRGQAQARLKLAQKERRSCRKDPQVEAPLTEKELMRCLEAQPHLQLFFSVTVSAQAAGRHVRLRKVVTPAVPDLALAMGFRRRLADALRAKDAAAALERVRRRVEKEAAEWKKLRRQREKQLLKAVSGELEARRQDQARPAGKRRRTGTASAAFRRESLKVRETFVYLGQRRGTIDDPCGVRSERAQGKF